MRVYVSPTVYEINEFLNLIRIRHDVDKVMPEPPEGMTLAEVLSMGICFLWYSEPKLNPLAITQFHFVPDQEEPFFNMAATHFAMPVHMNIIRRYMLTFMRTELNNKVLVHISDPRIERFAQKNGFTKKERNLWAAAEAEKSKSRKRRLVRHTKTNK